MFKSTIKKRCKQYFKGYRDCEKLYQKKLEELEYNQLNFIKKINEINKKNLEQIIHIHAQKVVEVSEVYAEVVQIILAGHTKQLGIFDDESKLQSRIVQEKINSLNKTLDEWRRNNKSFDEFIDMAEEEIEKKADAAENLLNGVAVVSKGWKDMRNIRDRARAFTNKKEKNNVAVFARRQD